MKDFEERLLTVGEVAGIMRVSIPTIYRRCRNGTFPLGKKYGGSRRWQESEIYGHIRNAPPSDNNPEPKSPNGGSSRPVAKVPNTKRKLKRPTKDVTRKKRD